MSNFHGQDWMFDEEADRSRWAESVSHLNQVLPVQVVCDDVEFLIRKSFEGLKRLQTVRDLTCPQLVKLLLVGLQTLRTNVTFHRSLARYFASYLASNQASVDPGTCKGNYLSGRVATEHHVVAYVLIDLPTYW